MSHLASFAIGLAFLIIGTALHRHHSEKHFHRFIVINNSHTVTNDPDHGPLVRIEKTENNTTFIGVGTGKHIPLPGFKSYEGAIKKLDYDLRWIKRASYLCLLVGLLLTIFSTGRYFLKD